MSSSHKKSHKKTSLSSSNKKTAYKGGHSSVTKRKLIDFLTKTSELQRKLQIIKETLCEDQDFTPASLFHRIDDARKGYIIERDIEQFLKANKVSFKGSQLKLLYGKINANQSNGGVNLREFQNFILPNQNPRIRYFTMRRPIYIPLAHQRLSDKIEWITAKLFAQIINEKVKLMEYNSALISSFDFNAEEIFELLSNEKGFITGQSLNKFTNDNNTQLSVQETGCIIKIMDKTGQGRIHLNDFKYHMATLGLKKQHQIFDELSPIPALKNFQNTELAVIKDRECTLKERYLDNKMYAQEFQKAQLARSRKSTALSRSRKYN